VPSEMMKLSIIIPAKFLLIEMIAK